MTANLSPPRVNLRNVALPVEHGGWGFLFEPIVLGLWVAPSLAGLWLSLAAIAAFLGHHPLKLVLIDRRKGRRYPRTVSAERFVLLYGLVAGVTLGLALLNSVQPFWLPLLLGAPFGLVQLYYEAHNRQREFVPELFGAVALGAVAAAIALAAEWGLVNSLALWSILITRAVVSITYVRARLRLERGGTPAVWPVLLVNGVGLLFIIGLSLLGLTPWLAVLALLILFGRAVYGLSAYRRPGPARRVGFQEIGYGLLTVVLVALGYTLGI